MDIQITPAKLSGAVTPPPSKSMAHRLIIAAALADGVSTLENIVPSQDIEATLRCMTVLGARWEAPKPGTICVHGIGRGHTFVDLPRFDCGESGSTLRFLIPIALAVAGGGVFTGHGRLMERPQGPYSGSRESLGNSVMAFSPFRAGCRRGSTCFRVTCPVSFSPDCYLPCRCWTLLPLS